MKKPTRFGGFFIAGETMSSLSIIFPAPVVTRLNGAPVTIKPVQLQHLEEFGKAAGELVRVAAAGDREQLYAYARNGDAVLAILGRCTSLSRWRIRRIPAAAALELMLQVVQVNSSFFEAALVRAASQLIGAR